MIIKWKFIAIMALFCRVLSAQVCCWNFPDPGFEGPEMRAFHGYYENPNYGFSLNIPKGLVGHDGPAPMPHHGFGIVLSWEPRSYLWVNGEYNSTEWKSSLKATQEHLSLMKGKLGNITSVNIFKASVGGRPATRLVLRYTCSDDTTARILHQVMFMRDQTLGIVYEAGIDTPTSREKEDLKVFGEIVGSWKMTEPK